MFRDLREGPLQMSDLYHTHTCGVNLLLAELHASYLVI